MELHNSTEFMETMQGDTAQHTPACWNMRASEQFTRPRAHGEMFCISEADISRSELRTFILFC